MQGSCSLNNLVFAMASSYCQMNCQDSKHSGNEGLGRHGKGKGEGMLLSLQVLMALCFVVIKVGKNFQRGVNNVI